MVVISAPDIFAIGVTQDRAGLPSMWTVQAPHSEIPQPYLVPVKPRWSRKNQSNGVSDSASSEATLFPLTVNWIIYPCPRGYLL